MGVEIVVHERIRKRHPEISAQDVLHAWRNAIVVVERSGKGVAPETFVAVGSDARGRMLELVGRLIKGNMLVIYHAQTPPSRKTIHELGLRGA